MKQSLITSIDRCYICKGNKQHIHHIFYGSANRKKSDEDGLTVPLCLKCHRDIHDKHLHDLELKQLAQTKWEAAYGSRDEFINRYGKNYL